MVPIQGIDSDHIYMKLDMKTLVMKFRVDLIDLSTGFTRLHFVY